MSRRWKERLVGLLFGVLAYVLVAWTVYRFRHTDMTETELFLAFWDAMTWG